MNAQKSLLNQIECLRKQMATVALNKGFTSMEAITISQELDKLLNSYQLKTHEEREYDL